MSTESKEKRSFILRLREEGRVNENFINTISDLTLEELIVIKLETSSKMMRGKLYNFPLWYTMPNVCKDALVLFARTCCSTKSDMASVLGIPYDYFLEIYQKYYKEY